MGGFSNTAMTLEDDQAEALRVMKTESFFDLFSVQMNTPAADIKKKYRQMALKFHPDRNKAPAASDAFNHISEGLRTLTDMSKRAAHLQTLRQKHSRPKPKAPRPQPRQQQQQQFVQQTCGNCSAVFGIPPGTHLCCPYCMFYRFN